MRCEANCVYRVINAEKSEFNEDQAACGQLSIKHRELGDDDQEWMILCQEEYVTGCYWALFDGHGGPAAAVIASNIFHSCLRGKLEDVVEGILAPQPPMHLSGCCICPNDPMFVEEKGIQAQDLVIGAIEKAFQECVSLGPELGGTLGWGIQSGRQGWAWRPMGGDRMNPFLSTPIGAGEVLLCALRESGSSIKKPP